jgi:predicted dienelactone hydrolase
MGAGTRWASLCAIVGLLGWVAWPASAGEPLALEIPALTGKAPVGTRSFELVDRSRPAGFDQRGPRRLMVQVTYPLREGRRSAEKHRCRIAPYVPDGTRDRLLSFIGLSGVVDVDTRTCDAGQVAGSALPLILFSPAYTANRAVYTSLVADLASRGFLVVSIDHTSEAFAVEFPSGEVVDGVYGTPLFSKPILEPELASLIEVRVRDVHFVTTWLLQQDRSRRSWLRGRIDPQRIGVFGHSLGGATATRVALVDRRFRASADVDGSLFGEWPLTAKSRKPFLLLVSEDGLGSVLPLDKSCRFFAAAAGPKVAWQLSGSKHLSFSDFQTLAPQIAAGRPDWPFAGLYPVIIGNLDPEASIRSQREAIARFFERHLGRRRAFGAEAPSPPDGVVPVTDAQLSCATGSD